MKRSSFKQEQIVAILKEQEAGMTTAEACRCHGTSSPFCKWKSKFSGLDVAEAMPDNAVFKDLASRNGNARREAGSRRPCPQASRGERG